MRGRPVRGRWLSWSVGILSPSTISAALFFIVGLIVATAALARRRSILENAFYLTFFSYIFLIGIGPLFTEQMDPLAPVMRGSFEPDTWTLFMSWSGLAALLWGYRSRQREASRTESARVSRSIGSCGRNDPNPLLIGGIVWTVIATIGTAAYLSKVGGLSYFFETAYGTRDDPSVYAGFYNLFRPGLFLVIAWALAAKVRAGLVWAGLLAYICFDLLWFGPIRGGRNETITLVLTLMYIAKHFADPKKVSHVGPLRRGWLLCAGVAIVLIWGGIRNYSIEDIVSGSSDQPSLLISTEAMVVKSVYETFQSFAGVVSSVPTQVPYQRGQTLFDSFTLIIPRAIWPSKPTPANSWLAQTFYGPEITASISTTWPGELYLNFGWLGLMLGMYWMGVACAKVNGLDPPKLDGKPAVWQGLKAAVWLPLPFVWIWGGSSFAVWHVLFNVVPIWIVFKLAKVPATGAASGYRREAAPVNQDTKSSRQLRAPNV